MMSLTMTCGKPESTNSVSQLQEVDQVVDDMLIYVSSWPRIQQIPSATRTDGEPVIKDLYAIRLDSPTHQPIIFNVKTRMSLKMQGSSLGPNTYLSVPLQTFGKKTSTHYLVASLVLLTFENAPPRNPHGKGCLTVQHKDGNRRNNSLHNLEYISPSEQIRSQSMRNNVRGRNLTAMHSVTEQMIPPQTAHKMQEYFVEIGVQNKSGVTYLLGQAKKNQDITEWGEKQRGPKGWIIDYAASHDDDRIASLEFSEVPSILVGGNTTVKCSREGHVSWNGGKPTSGFHNEKCSNAYKVVGIPEHSEVRLKGNAGISPRKFQVHRLILWAWGFMAQEDKVVDHLDGNKHNNFLDNLQWVTASENHLRANMLYESIVKLHPKSLAVITKYPSIKHAVADTGLDGICTAIRQKEVHGGFLWQTGSYTPPKAWGGSGLATIVSAVHQKNEAGNIMCSFDTLQSAAESFARKGVCMQKYMTAQAMIFRAACGKTLGAYGFFWEFADPGERAKVLLAARTKHGKGTLRCKPVACFDLKTGTLIDEFDSGAIAHESTGACAGHISDCMKGKRSHSKGLAWAYAC